MAAAKIYHELLVVYGQNVMSNGTVRQWCRMFKDGFGLRMSKPKNNKSMDAHTFTKQVE
jgi:hypothetical protein